MSTALQRQLRHSIWRGFAITLLVFTAFAFALDYVGDEPTHQRQAQGEQHERSH
ncbi:hypothetical protein SAMN05216206_2796 [Pseudomonas guineae]|uniref:Uncharacterized protein n=1 Tax=Pseudomonas guineae TaxID=425504 RepID=A0A1I3KE12_9PSED|nr:hypothetical protein SAMN05216206_2796 [Pseudomonas guineae]